MRFFTKIHFNVSHTHASLSIAGTWAMNSIFQDASEDSDGNDSFFSVDDREQATYSSGDESFYSIDEHGGEWQSDSDVISIDDENKLCTQEDGRIDPSVHTMNVDELELSDTKNGDQTKDRIKFINLEGQERPFRNHREHRNRLSSSTDPEKGNNKAKISNNINPSKDTTLRNLTMRLDLSRKEKCIDRSPSIEILSISDKNNRLPDVVVISDEDNSFDAKRILQIKKPTVEFDGIKRFVPISSDDEDMSCEKGNDCKRGRSRSPNELHQSPYQRKLRKLKDLTDRLASHPIKDETYLQSVRIDQKHDSND